MRRLIVFILIFAIFLAFIILNLESKSDISFGFAQFYDVPIFISIFLALVLGMLIALLMLLPIFKGRDKPFSLPLKKGPKVPPKLVDEIKKEPSSYGID
ncbi:MAG: cytochrome P450 [Treponema sp.]|nr:cytochrome P450 [Treponema sp.]